MFNLKEVIVWISLCIAIVVYEGHLLFDYWHYPISRGDRKELLKNAINSFGNVLHCYYCDSL